MKKQSTIPSNRIPKGATGVYKGVLKVTIEDGHQSRFIRLARTEDGEYSSIYVWDLSHVEGPDGPLAVQLTESHAKRSRSIPEWLR